MGSINTRGQSTKEALTAVMSQLKEKTGDKFLLEKGLGKDDTAATPPLEGAGAPDAHSPCLDEAVSHSLMGLSLPTSRTPSLREGLKWVFWTQTVHLTVL